MGCLQSKEETKDDTTPVYLPAGNVNTLTPSSPGGASSSNSGSSGRARTINPDRPIKIVMLGPAGARQMELQRIWAGIPNDRPVLDGDVRLYHLFCMSFIYFGQFHGTMCRLAVRIRDE